MSGNQLEELNAELVDAIKLLLRNRIPHHNAIAYAKSVVAKAEVKFRLFATSPIMTEDLAEYILRNGLQTPGQI